MNRLFANLFAFLAPKTPSLARRRAASLAVNALEDRWCPSAVVTTANAGHTIVITGDANANHVVVTQNDATDKLKIVADGKTYNFTSSDVTALKVDLKAGNDTFAFNLDKNTGYSFGKAVDLKLGAGNDDASIEFRGDKGNSPVYLLSSLKINVDAGAGNDSLNANFGAKHGGKLELTAAMGDGNDSANARLWGDVSGGAKVKFQLLGNAGNDSLGTWNAFDQNDYAMNSIDITHDASVDINLNGGSGNDTLGALYTGDMEGKLNVIVDGNAGKDTVEADIYFQVGSDGNFVGEVLGGKGNDVLTFNLVTKPGAAPKEFALIDGGLGFDKAHPSGNVVTLNCEA